MSEFKGFIRELVRGLGVVFPSIKEFKDLPPPFLYPFAEFLPNLLDAEPIKPDELVERIAIERNNLEKLMLFEGRRVAASEILFAFIHSLDGRQLAQLVGVWTGSSTLSLRDVELKVTFFMPNQQTPSIRTKFCDSNNLIATNNSVSPLASVKEYMVLFDKFVKTLLGEDRVLEPECPDEGIDFNLTRLSICAKSLIIYLQSVQQMFNSLFDLLTTPLAAIRDS